MNACRTLGLRGAEMCKMHCVFAAFQQWEMWTDGLEDSLLCAEIKQLWEGGEGPTKAS